MINIQEVVHDLNTRPFYAPQAWVVKINGNMINLTKKSSWRTAAHAKAALTNYLSNKWYRKIQDFGFSTGPELSTFLIKEGIITIEQL